jgi:hypothetical protein
MRKISPALFGMVLILFLLPWISVSCGGQKVFTFSGTDLSIGKTIEIPNGFGKVTKQTSRDWKASLALLSGLAGLVVSFVIKKERLRSNILMFASVFSGVMLFEMRNHLNSEILKQGGGIISIDFHFGFWAAMIIFFGISIFILLDQYGYLGKITSRMQSNNSYNNSVSASFCSECGAKISSADTFCSECGHSLK